MILYRPVGLEELRLVYEADMQAFPPRLPDQPIFYPVLNEPYAAKIAKDWNTKAGSLAGFVTRFNVDDAYAGRFERRVVGSQEHEELWVLAEELPAFNQNIQGLVEVTAAYFGEGCRGLVPDSFGLAGKSAHEQFIALARTLPYSGFDVVCELTTNHVAVFLNFSYWQQKDFSVDGIDAGERDNILSKLESVWSKGARSRIPLGLASGR